MHVSRAPTLLDDELPPESKPIAYNARLKAKLSDFNLAVQNLSLAVLHHNQS